MKFYKTIFLVIAFFSLCATTQAQKKSKEKAMQMEKIEQSVLAAKTDAKGIELINAYNASLQKVKEYKKSKTKSLNLDKGLSPEQTKLKVRELFKNDATYKSLVAKKSEALKAKKKYLRKYSKKKKK